MKTKYCGLLLLLASSLPAIEDSPENRNREAQRYMETTDALSPALLADMVEPMARKQPPEQRAAFRIALTNNLEQGALAKAARDALAKHFTADELKALSDFYGSNLGKSAMKKFGGYTADLLPALDAEIAKAAAKVERELQDQSKKTEPHPTPEPTAPSGRGSP